MRYNRIISYGRGTLPQLIENTNNRFLLEVLSPEIRENEKKKRKHKDWLMGFFLSFGYSV